MAEPRKPRIAVGSAAVDVEVRDEVRAGLLLTVRTLTAWVGPLFLLFAPIDYVYSGPQGLTLAGLDMVVALACIAVHVFVRLHWIGPAQAPLSAGLVCLAALPYVLANLWVTGLPVYSAGLALWQMGIGLILLSWPWMLLLLATSNAAWVYLAFRLNEANPSPDWFQYGFVLAAATVMGIVAHGVRLRSIHRLEGLRLGERARRRELENAHSQAQQLDAVRRVNEIKTAFINTAAHELSTPMTPILLQARLLRDQLSAVPGLNPEVARSVDILERNLERLRALLQDVLDGARLQADHLSIQFAAVDLAEMARFIVAEYEEAARRAKVRIVCHAPDPAPVRGDPKRLQQVVANLVSNAVKFTPAGGTVEVRAQPAGSGAYVQVRDTGIGLDPVDRARLFQAFVQVHDLAAVQSTGTGLGLYICKGIVERHGGEIGVKSDGKGRGSAFWFTVP